MNLSDIDNKFQSHPDYPYSRHIGNIADSFDEQTHKEAACFHDLGKLSDEFQAFICNTQKGKKTTHALEGALFFLSQKEYRFSKETFAVFLSVLRHHGDLENTNAYLEHGFSDSEELLYQYPNLEKRLNLIRTRANLENVPNIEKVCELFEADNFVKKNRLNSIETYFFLKEVFSKLIFADKFEAIFRGVYCEDTPPDWEIFKASLIQLIESKRNTMTAIRNEARNEIIKNYFSNKTKRIFIIEAPTGIGKTFSALHLALEIAAGKKKKKIITALPMTSIIDQTFNVYLNVIDEKHLLKYHHLTHSKNYVDSYQESMDEAQKYRQKNDFLAMSWAHDSVIVTTFNQLFNAFYSNRNRDLIKFWGLRDSVIILDEIQAIPRILLQDISKTISFLATEFNIDFILMSATIPEIKHFIGREITAELLDNRYFAMDFNNRYTLCLRADIDDEVKLIDEILKEYDCHNSILCVVNTKKLSLKIFRFLEKHILSDQLFLLNTNFIPKQRKKIIEDIKARLKDNQKTVLVSTQVIEAGVDLDFDYGIREFAPLYSIIQTAGRINREGLKTNSTLTITEQISRRGPYLKNDLLKPEVLVLLHDKVPENEILPLLKKYFHEAIERTYRDPLLFDLMHNLDYESVYRVFDQNFMRELPFISPVFIEVEAGLYEAYAGKMSTIISQMRQKDIPLSDRMRCKSEISELNKEMGQFIINVAEKEAADLPDFHEAGSLKVCGYEHVKSEEKYSSRTGWIGEETNTIFF